ncbi:sister chromatid cohesion protein PDS5 homolog A isoform X1 [Hippoglossus stenolepis]|uniref:sister chromatid cohesion protein PDS5 homolog A isoform X1 n=1 Tax=Hippoglossus stenolepis TaxID=195615 RepID=UPI00159C251F|nr:sister chromatid cohesion protein PDS5 homolog A isoform X1 [Hippoglossus stenolepis]XP_035029828.1 sister chromatid cohesion protein PDS5 homolog A isoform X1 [Hippoglossus stenolepis]XP_035029836.1 sister chromatid cohesion protein PDS5 homolog A isoform X1 [Hippoglossus stenolepis]XP_035029846.1 sister chromatid cohesion protein PDS5 homolog A isoform X1 [Hippoglossus stenolepis]
MEFPQQQKPAGDGKITYPPGVKEITDKISNDEVVKRLKMVVKTYMDMDQDSEEEKQQYLNLALHLASEFFLRNPNKDVRLLVACCLADIFRIYAPEAPYTSHDKLKDIFLFITRQLKGLEDTKSPQFNRYFYLLENLAWVKSYNICFELEDCNEIFIQLFKSLFTVINNSHNQKVQMHMMDLMSSIIMEGDGVTQELLDTILINLIPAHKNLNKQAYDLAKTLLKRTVQTIETCIANFFNQVLVMGKSSVSDLSEHVFDLIQELFAIDPMLLTSVMPQLEFKLKSNDGEERLAVVRLLAKLFGAKDSELASQNRPLWQCFLGRFNDIHVPVRLECVKFASHCLMNHPDLARDLTEFLKVRSHDPEEAIRHDVIVTIINAGKKDLNLVNDQLLGFVRERTLDKRWRVRKEAMMGLAQLYKKYCLHHEAGKECAQKISWIKDKLLHIYYQNSIDDKLLVEKIFAQYMVPHSLDTEEKMKCLYYLYACLDTNAVKALNEMWKCQNMLRGLVKELLDLHKLPLSEANNNAMFGKLMSIAKNLPDAGKAQDFMKRFNQVLGEDEKLRVQLEMLISPTCSCKQAEICVREITRKLTFPKQPTNPFLEMVKFLLERIAPVHIDSEAISALVKLLNKSTEGTADDDEEGVTPDTAIRSGLELLKVLSFTHPTAFHSAETYESLLQCLKMEDDKVAEAAIQIFRNTGQKIEAELQQIKSTLIPILHQKAKRGTPHQAKQAVHCIHAIFNNKEVQLAQIFEPLSRSLNADVPEQLITPLVSLGHISMLAPDQFASPMKSIVANFIVKDLLMNDRSVGNKNGKLWTTDEEVSPEVLAKVQAIKLLVRWLLGMKNNQSKSANSTLRLLSAMLVSEGDLTEQKKISKSDMSRLRLAAGGAIMKLAQELCYHDIITPEQFQLCGLVINDECYQVRQIFAQKLHLALVKLVLPLEYLAVFALCAKDPVKERRAHARQCLLKNISVRREFIKQNPIAQEKLISLLPEYVVPYMIHLLAHDPDFTKPQEYDQLKDIKECLWFMLEVLMTKNENNSHAFLRKMVENIKQTKDAQCPEDVKANEKLYIVCDVALFVIANKSTACHLDSPKDPVLPPKFFILQDKDFKNDKEYLLTEMRQMLLSGKPKPAPVLATVNKPLTVPGRRIFTKATPVSDTASNTSTNSSPLSSSTINKNSNAAIESSESRVQENNENPTIKNNEGKKEEPSQNATPDAGTEASPVKRRGRPPKTAATPGAEKKEAGAPTVGGAGRGRKRAADSNPSAESVNIKMSKQQQQQNDEGTKRQIDLQSRWPFVSSESEKVRKREPGKDTGRAAVGTVAHLLGSEGDTEMEPESSPEGVTCDRKNIERCPLTQEQTSGAARSNKDNQGDARFPSRGEPNSGERAGGLAVKRKPVKGKSRL